MHASPVAYPAETPPQSHLCLPLLMQAFWGEGSTLCPMSEHKCGWVGGRAGGWASKEAVAVTQLQLWPMWPPQILRMACHSASPLIDLYGYIHPGLLLRPNVIVWAHLIGKSQTFEVCYAFRRAEEKVKQENFPFLIVSWVMALVYKFHCAVSVFLLGSFSHTAN